MVRKIKVYETGDIVTVIHRLNYGKGDVIADKDWKNRNIAHPDSGETAKKVLMLFYNHYNNKS